MKTLKVAVFGRGVLADATREVVADIRSRAALELVLPQFCEVLWYCGETPVDENDECDISNLIIGLDDVLSFARPGAIVLVSSPVPVGTLRKLEQLFPSWNFATQPENVRRATAVADLWCQSRIVVGTRHSEDREPLTRLFKQFTPGEIHFISPESAEMVKHGLNAFLALEITFANELSDLCSEVGADVDDVFRGFRSDRRVGNGPLNPGDPITGGTLLRDVAVLDRYVPGPVIAAIRPSNTRRLPFFDRCDLVDALIARAES